MIFLTFLKSWIQLSQPTVTLTWKVCRCRSGNICMETKTGDPVHFNAQGHIHTEKDKRGAMLLD